MAIFSDIPENIDLSEKIYYNDFKIRLYRYYGTIKYKVRNLNSNKFVYFKMSNDYEIRNDYMPYYPEDENQEPDYPPYPPYDPDYPPYNPNKTDQSYDPDYPPYNPNETDIPYPYPPNSSDDYDWQTDKYDDKDDFPDYLKTKLRKLLDEDEDSQSDSFYSEDEYEKESSHEKPSSDIQYDNNEGRYLEKCFLFRIQTKK